LTAAGPRRRRANAFPLLLLILVLLACSGCRPGPAAAPGTEPAESGSNARDRGPQPAGGTAAIETRPAPHVTLHSVDFATEAVGWALASTEEDGAYTARILRTTDGGREWTDVTPKGLSILFTRAHRPSARFVGGTTCWVAGQPTGEEEPALVVARTRDGGRTWRLTNLSVPEVHDVGEVYIDFLAPSNAGSDPRDGWMLVTSTPALGLMLKTVYGTGDGGRSWTKLSCVSDAPETSTPDSLPLARYPTGISFVDALRGWVTLSSRGEIVVPAYRTLDGGATWELQDVPVPADYRDGCGDPSPPLFWGETGVMLVQLKHPGSGPAVVPYVTDDGGSEWKTGKPLPVFASSWDFVDSERGWVLAWDGRTLYVTEDGGRTWAQRAVDADLKQARLDFVSAEAGWALTQESQDRRQELWRTHDGGSTWHALRPRVVSPPGGPPSLEAERSAEREESSPYNEKGSAD